MPNLQIRLKFRNATMNHRSGSDEIMESRFSKRKDLFRSCQKEYGKCVSKIYVDLDDTRHAVGWVFEKKMQYDDSKEFFQAETWVEVFD